MKVNKLLAAALRAAGPTEDLQRAVSTIIARFGKEAVKKEVLRQAKPKRGRKPELDWPELREVITTDARDWLGGGNPLKTRTNYKIAKDFAQKNPGQSEISTHKRIEKKLKQKPYDRTWFMLVTAERLGKKEYPYTAYIRTLEELCKLDDSPAWSISLETAKSYLASYTQTHGQPPPEQITMQEVEENAYPRNALAALGNSGLFPINHGSS